MTSFRNQIYLPIGLSGARGTHSVKPVESYPLHFQWFEAKHNETELKSGRQYYVDESAKKGFSCSISPNYVVIFHKLGTEPKYLRGLTTLAVPQ